ncbi:MAG: bifunctional folylpolyglutamate synthase/dihydrofolate synthase [Chloroflexi bacterium]|nr:bifunctional folylpolyglutamate synthase/dihydrofolate synthase [Chloroflexota bacterium]
MNYQETLDYIYSFINYEKTGMPAATTANYNLERMASFLERLGNPQHKYPSIVIAGTKGKGSTAALCESALRVAGYRVGLYTQPHLHSYRERMRINQRLISQETLAELVTRLRPVIEESLTEADRFGCLTTYEIGTGLALQYFAEQQVDLAVLEVGLGGRLDAVNVVEPLVSVITSISLDHIAVLGDTVAKIAAEKAGIIKPGIPVVVAPQVAEALAVIEEVCREKASPLEVVEAAESLSPAQELSEHNRGQKFQRVRLSGQPEIFELPLLGEHQLINVALAAKVLEALAQRGLKVEPEQIAEGFRQVAWPGRLEVLEDKPGRPLLVVDGAHNAESAMKLGQALNRINFYYQRVIFIVGTSSDKDVEGIFRELRQSSDGAALPQSSDGAALPQAFILTRSNHPRALSPAKIQQRGFGSAPLSAEEPRVMLTESVSEALEVAHSLAQPLDLICATGSLFVVAEVREACGLGQEKD